MTQKYGLLLQRHAAALSGGRIEGGNHQLTDNVAAPDKLQNAVAVGNSESMWMRERFVVAFRGLATVQGAMPLLSFHNDFIFDSKPVLLASAAQLILLKSASHSGARTFLSSSRASTDAFSDQLFKQSAEADRTPRSALTASCCPPQDIDAQCRQVRLSLANSGQAIHGIEQRAERLKISRVIC